MKRLLIVGLLVVEISSVRGTCDDEVVDQAVLKVREKQAWMVAKQFVKAWFKHRDIEDLMDVVAVGHYYGWGDLSRFSGDLDDLKKFYEYSIAEDQRFRPDPAKLSIHVREARPYDEYFANEGKGTRAENRDIIDAVMKKTDCFVRAEMKYEGKSDRNLWVWVTWREGEAKVVGSYLIVGSDG